MQIDKGAYELGANELIVDLFAGGGGASEGLYQATGRHPDIAINHDEDAVAVHERNHPTCRHFCQSIWKVHPLEAVGDRPVGLLWASPACQHFSRAAGGVPKSKQSRSLPGVVLTWAKYVRPKVICVENVAEMEDWGPLLEDGTPCQKRKGRSFKCWVGRLRGMGYSVEWKKLCAADYGVPTIRTRLFIVARCDGKPIVWPQATHHKSANSLFEQPWRGAHECIDWSIPCPSIFARKRSLKDATLRRIAEGVMRYVVNAKEPFIVRTTTVNDKALVVPHVSSLYGTSVGSGATEPLGSVTAQGQHHALVAAHLAPITHQGSGRGSSLDRPMPTLTCANRGEQALISAFMAQHNGGAIGHDMRSPVSALTARSTQQQLVAATLAPGEVERAERTAAFIMHYYSHGKQAQSLRDPLGAVTTKGRYALVTVAGIPIVDIGMRMLAPHELQAAQGFRPDYDLTDGERLTKTASIRLIGNSVCPGMAAAVVRANVKPEPVRTMERIAA